MRVKTVFGSTLTGNETGPAVLGSFVPKVLGQGKYKVAPAPWTLKAKAIESIQEGFDVLKKGVSAKKIVVCGLIYVRGITRSRYPLGTVHSITT